MSVRVFAVTLACTAGLMVLVWLLSLLKRDASIVDIFWGLGFVLITMVAAASGDGYDGRRLLVVTLCTVWGLRLSLYLLRRNWGKGEDFRYQAMRRRYGERFGRVSLLTVFGLQGGLMWLISLPLQVAVSAPHPASLTIFDVLGALLWSVGFGFEAVGDWQLARFKDDPGNQSKVMDRGLWAYTRHPNYFGDALLWWGFYVVALATRQGLWTFPSPLLMTFLLLRVSGVPLLERGLVKKRPEYADYARRTSVFLPWPPSKGTV